MLQVYPRSIFQAALVLVAISLPLVTHAGDEPACKSTQAANDLRSCTHCREAKRILSDPGLSGVSFEVTSLRLGATVEISADSDEARLLVQELVAHMWGQGPAGADQAVCDYCRKRQVMLADVLVDWTATADGVQLVLISQDPELARWALQDARSTQGWVLSSAEN
jgi:glutaredoxin